MYLTLPGLVKWPGIMISLLTISFSVAVLLAGAAIVRSATATTPCTTASTSQSCQVASANRMMDGQP